jgi:hypothetical protein
VNITQFSKQWVLADFADWRVYVGHEPAGIMREDLSHVQCAYHTYFAVPPHDVCSWRVPSVRRNTDKPVLPRYFTVPLQPDLQVALARFRLSAHNLQVVRGRYVGEEFFDQVCGLTDDAL